MEHHRKGEVPYRLIHCDGELSVGDPDANAGDLLVQGDNLGSLEGTAPLLWRAGEVYLYRPAV